MEKRYAVCLGLLACMMMALAVASPEAYALPSVGDPVPEFTLDDLDGNPFAPSGQTGKVLMLDFWAPMCGPCRTEIPYLVQWQDRYRSRGLVICGVAVWGASWGSTDAQVRAFAAEYKINYTLCIDTKSVSDLYGVRSIPVTVIVDRSGIVRHVHEGFSVGSVPGMEAEIEALLGESSVSVTSISPNSAPNTGIVNITEITGEGFGQGASVKLTKAGQADIPGGDVVVVSETKITCKFDLSGKAVGKWNVVVTNPDEKAGTLSEGFTVVSGALPPPTVTGITPSSGNDDGSVYITNLAGTGFQNGAVVKLTRDGESDIVAENVSVESATKITCAFDLTARAAGAWNVVVTNPDSQSGTLQGGFTVVAVPAPPPSVTSITPNSGINSGVVTISNLAGASFRSGATVKLTRSGQTDIAGSNVVVVSANSITCAFDLTGGAVGQWNVVVTNPDGKSCTLANGFTINAAPTPAPVVSSITPSSGSNDGMVGITDLAGSHFQSGAAVKLTRLGQSDIVAGDVVVVSSTRITCTLDLTGRAPGQWTVVVTNPDGQTGTLANGFSVAAEEYDPPTISSITPNSAANDGSVSITNLAGTGFRSGVGVKLTKTGQVDIPATNVTVVSGAQITCDFGLTGRLAGLWNVVVTNTDGQSATLVNGFTITTPVAQPPTVTAITPDSGANDGPVEITELSGSGFQSGAVAKLTRQGQPDIVAADTNVISTTRITCTFDLTGKPAGLWNVVVVNADSLAGSLANGFRIDNPLVPPPTVAGMWPKSRANTGVLVVDDLAGSGFQEGAVVAIYRPKVSGAPAMQPGQAADAALAALPIGDVDEYILATDVVVVSATRITCRLDIYGATPGKWGVAVVNPDEQWGTLPDALEVLPAPVLPPIVGSVTPASAVNTAPVTVRVSGIGFQQGAIVKLTRSAQPDVTATNTVVNGPEAIDCTLDVSGKAVGKWSIVVTNPDGQTGSRPEAFTVVEQLRVTSITPNTGLNTGLVSIADLAGAGFSPGAVVKLTAPGRPDVIAEDVSVLNSGKITCKFNLAHQAVGRWNVVVTNTSGHSAELAEAFSVCDAPTIVITEPVTGSSCCRNFPSVRLAGAAFDNEGVVRVTWTNNRGGSGLCTGADSWCADGIPLLGGENTITVTAIDSSGRTSSDSIIVSYTDSQPGDAWRGLAMVSMPIIPDLTDPKAVVGFAGNAWSMYWTSAGQYISYGADPERFTWLSPREATPGRGFWARFDGQAPMPVGTIPPQDREAVIRLYPGWNLIGQPFITPVVWDMDRIEVEASGVRRALKGCDAVAQFAWGWDPAVGSYYLVSDPTLVPGATDSLAPWQAYWIKARRECSLILTAD